MSLFVLNFVLKVFLLDVFMFLWFLCIMKTNVMIVLSFDVFNNFFLKKQLIIDLIKEECEWCPALLMAPFIREHGELKLFTEELVTLPQSRTIKNYYRSFHFCLKLILFLNFHEFWAATTYFSFAIFRFSIWAWSC